MPQLAVTRLYVDDLKVHDIDDPACQFGLRSAVLKRAPRRVTSARTQRRGSRSRTKFLESAVIDLAGYVIGSFTDQQSLYGQLEQKLLDLDGPHTIRFLRRGAIEEEQLEAELIALDAPAEGYAALIRWSATLEADDPAVYTASQRVAAYDPTLVISTGGFDMPMVFPLVMATTTATHLELVNDGVLTTPPVIEIRGPIGSPSVTNDTTGEYLQIVYTLGDSDIVVVNVGARTVTLNGALRPDLFASASNWVELVPGTNLIRLSGAGMVGGKTTLTARWRAAR